VTRTVIRGHGAAGGIAVGDVVLFQDSVAETAVAGGGFGEVERALAALAAVAAELERAAGRLRRAGLEAEAEIVETTRMLAEDPVLHENVSAGALELPAPHAVNAAVERHANALAALPDPMLAARASDVRELGRRAARILTGGARAVIGDRSIVCARDLGPGEVADLELDDGRVMGIALADGAATSHAAIMARALGVPLVVGLGPSLLALDEGETVIVDGDRGLVVGAPTPAEVDEARRAVRRAARRRSELAAMRSLPAKTTDGRRITLLCNASTAAEVAAGLAAGADGVGLLRTELAFLDAHRWPTQAEHLAALEPPLSLLAGRLATVRTLDFGADKTPPFLQSVTERGVALTLQHPEAFVAQLRAIITAAADTRLRLLLPLVRTASDIRAVRSLVRACLPPGATLPALGAMIETPEAAHAAHEIALEADFLSIGTNDLVATTLGLDRGAPVASVSTAADPAVLELVRRTVAAAEAAGVTVEVCGESASEPALAVLFVGLGVDELSVAPARLDVLRATIRGISSAEARAAAAAALAAGSADDALAVGASLAGPSAPSAKLGDDRGETRDGVGGLVA
jgi:phosphoenolpyruvate-protein kinase (PTS system EI component)